MNEPNQNPEQIARDRIDTMLRASGWVVQDKNAIDLGAGLGVAIREFQTDVGPVDYMLYVDRKPAGVIEAKREEIAQNITTVEEQSGGYAEAGAKFIAEDMPRRFVYESTGEITRFTDMGDPKPRSREVFTFHRPETLKELIDKGASLQSRLQGIPALDPEGLRKCQVIAIENLEASFKINHPRALIQMATGAGKTYAAATSIYRLLKHADAKRILFLVDTKNLGEQAEQEFMSYVPSDDNRKFTELYNVRRLNAPYVPADAQVCISTIQRMYSILREQPLEEAAEEINPAEMVQAREPVPVVYNPKVPIEFFDYIFIDECHRSIYNLWQQVLDYFDASLIGLTATPDNRTYGFFKKNVVSEYTHEEAVADKVNVGHEIFHIETRVTGGVTTVEAGVQVEKREKLTRKKRWEQQDEDESYTAQQLDRSIVNPDQIRTVIRAFRDNLPQIFPGRSEVPKTLIFAKTDSHADDIIQCVREEFGESNKFCKKITYKVTEDPKSVLSQFRNDFYPRIAVTVDMIATGTDVKPLECLIFMRDVKSRNYFEQMKGRGTRTLSYDDLKRVTRDATTDKTHFVIVDAIGVTRSLKTASQPAITKPSVPLKDLAMGVMMGVADEDTVSSLAGRLARLNHQIGEREQTRIREAAGGMALTDIVGALFGAIDPDKVEAEATRATGKSDPTDEDLKSAQGRLVGEVAKIFTGELIELVDTIRRDREQTIDHENLDEVLNAGWEGDADEIAKAMAGEFSAWLEENRDTIAALEIFYDQPHRRRELTFEMIRDVFEKLREDRPRLAPARVWLAYAHLDGYKGANPVSELTMLMALIRRACGFDETLSTYSDTVRRNFQTWIMKEHAGTGPKFTPEQLTWLQMIRDHVISSFHLAREDLNLAPFDSRGGMGKMHQLFGDGMDDVIDELNGALAA